MTITVTLPTEDGESLELELSIAKAIELRDAIDSRLREQAAEVAAELERRRRDESAQEAL